MHNGELELHRLLGVPEELSARMPLWPAKSMDEGRRKFFVDLPYIGLGTVDPHGRPWATCFVGQLLCGPNRIELSSSRQHSADPVLKALCSSAAMTEPQPWAAVGVDFSNRRRNKVEGVVEPGAASWTHTTQFRGALRVEATMGNCPKYINVRKVHAVDRPNAVALQARGPLPAEVVELVHRSDTVFVASRHLDTNAGGTMDVNHRGGAPGFCRSDGRVIVMPDYSGNRIYSSLGNIRSDGCAGLCFCDFVTGDILHVTGAAQVLVGEQSQAMMPRINVCVVLTVDEFIWIRSGLALVQEGEVQLGDAHQDHSLELLFVGAEQRTPTMKTFRFRVRGLAQPPKPGQYATVNCESLRPAPRTYMHMNDERPQSLSDDFIRTWTVSNSPVVAEDSEYVLEFTVKLAPTGAVSPLLHAGQRGLEGLRLMGISGDFVCSPAVGADAVWIAAGSGVTPFMAMVSAATVPVTMVLVLRREDAALALPFDRSPLVKLHLFVTDVGSDGAVEELRRLLPSSSIGRGRPGPDAIPVRRSATYWVCGPSPFLTDVRLRLDQAGVSPSAIVTESFAF